MKIIIGITGASGSIYARLLAESLLKQKDIEISVIVTDNGRRVMQFEDYDGWLDDSRITIFDNSDMFGAPASGSAGFDAMVIIPCSMGTMGRIASGVSADLLCRAADVMIKERKKLIVVPRETPISAIHIDNMKTLTSCGAILVPASPSFYSKPQSIEDLCRTVTDRVVSLLGLTSDGFIWK